VVARDEALALPEVLPTLRWADEVLVVVDDATVDATALVARSLADHVEVRTFGSFPAFRNAALALASQQWVFFVDADERVSAALAGEVQAAVAASEASIASDDRSAPVGYWVPRHNVMFGRLIQGGGWSPDYQLRLLHRDHARYDETWLVHERVILDGTEGHLQERLLHLSYRSPSEFLAKQHRYALAEVASDRARGVRYRQRALVGQPLHEFARRFFALGGWRDGPIGLFLCAAMAYAAYERVRLVRTQETRSR
jgi:glycosyltransferase involved in cell wall biosynthesis